MAAGQQSLPLAARCGYTRPGDGHSLSPLSCGREDRADCVLPAAGAQGFNATKTRVPVSSHFAVGLGPVTPPLGLVLLWLRSETRLRRKVLGSAVILVLGVVYLHVFFGLRMERDGGGLRPIFSFHKPEAHYTELERSRSEHGCRDC